MDQGEEPGYPESEPPASDWQQLEAASRGGGHSAGR